MLLLWCLLGLGTELAKYLETDLQLTTLWWGGTDPTDEPAEQLTRVTVAS